MSQFYTAEVRFEVDGDAMPLDQAIEEVFQEAELPDGIVFREVLGIKEG